MPDILFDWFSKYANDHQKYLKTLHSFTENVITTRRTQMQIDLEEANTILEGSKKRKLAFLDLLLEFQSSGAENALTDLDIREEVSKLKFMLVLLKVSKFIVVYSIYSTIVL